MLVDMGSVDDFGNLNEETEFSILIDSNEVYSVDVETRFKCDAGGAN